MIKIDPRYLAGVMDSDGSLSITKRHLKRKNINYTIMIQLTWKLSDETLLFIESLKEQYGGSYHINNRKHQSQYKHSKTTIKYCSTGTSAIKILNDISKHLVLKKEQASNLLLVDSLKNSYEKYHKPRPIDITNQLEDLYLLNKQLNGGSSDAVDIL